MDNQNYLNKIAAEARPAKKSLTGKSGFFKSPWILGGLIAAVVVMIVIIVVSSLGTNEGPRERTIALELHLENDLAVISEYQDSVKSSDLRSSSASLYSVLSNTSRELATYLTETYNYKTEDLEKKYANLVEAATLERDGLTSALFEAKITGVLDRTYATKMAYEITSLTNEESALYADADETLKTVLETSHASLTNLYPSFSTFSPAK